MPKKKAFCTTLNLLLNDKYKQVYFFETRKGKREYNTLRLSKWILVSTLKRDKLKPKSTSKCIINCKQPMNSLLRSQSTDLNQGLQDDYFTLAKENCKWRHKHIKTLTVFLYKRRRNLSREKELSDWYLCWLQAAKNQRSKQGKIEQRTPAAQGQTGSAQPQHRGFDIQRR